MVGIIKGTTAVASAAILIDYHRHGRFVHDGVFSDDKTYADSNGNKVDLQYKFDHSKIPEMVAEGKQNYQLAKMAYAPEEFLKKGEGEITDLGLDSKDTDRYTFLARTTDKYGLKATAFRDNHTGEVVMSVAGMETKHAAGTMEKVKDVYSAFKSTAGAVSQSTENLVKFAEQVSKEHGKISTISGHSLGSYLGMQLKVIGDKNGLTTSDCKLFSYDTPGMTHALAEGLKEEYKINDPDIVNSLHNKNVYTFINDSNSYNTLGGLPGNIITATDPNQTKYVEYAISHLMPKEHFLPYFNKSFAENNFKYEGNNLGHARGPEYLTALTAGGVAGAFHPYGYAIIAEPVLRHAQGALADAMIGKPDTLPEPPRAEVKDYARAQNGEAPKMAAYTNLNMLYMECSAAQRAKGFSNEEADAYAKNSDNLKLFGEEKIAKKNIELSNRGVVDKSIGWFETAFQKVSGFLLDRDDFGDMSTTIQDLEIKQTQEALKEIPAYKQDCEKHAKASKCGLVINPVEDAVSVLSKNKVAMQSAEDVSKQHIASAQGQVTARHV
jgi:hypothetical protein